MGVVKKSCIVMAAAILCTCILPIDKCLCEDQDIKAAEGEKTKKAIEVNNLLCPVSDDDIIPAKAVKYEYKGKIYSFCCDACVKHFKKYPDKFVRKTLIF